MFIYSYKLGVCSVYSIVNSNLFMHVPIYVHTYYSTRPHAGCIARILMSMKYNNILMTEGACNVIIAN